MDDIGIDFEPVKKYVIHVDKVNEDGSAIEVGKYRTSSKYEFKACQVCELFVY